MRFLRMMAPSPSACACSGNARNRSRRHQVVWVALGSSRDTPGKADADATRSTVLSAHPECTWRVGVHDLLLARVLGLSLALGGCHFLIVSLIDSAIFLAGPLSLLFGVSPRFADRAAPAAFCWAPDLEGIPTLLYSASPLWNGSE